MLKIDKVQLEIIVNGDPARLKMTKLSKEAANFKNEYKKAKTELEKQVALDKLNAVEKQMEDLRHEIGLAGLSMRELGQRSTQLKAILSNLKPDSKEWREYNRELQAVTARQTELRNQSSGLTKAFGQFKELLPTLGIGALVGGIVSLGKAIYQTRSEFQKYEAILKNTLGSEDAARGAMNMLTDAAEELPISLKEATESYIKLVNRGMNPTKEEMIKLTDVAQSQGKSLDQFVEAMLDAQTGEFERLKEFGVRAKSEGDKVTFTFKGQTQTVQKTDEAIQKYLLSLADLPGVAGSSAAVMETLEGKASNLGDAWDRLLNNMGKKTEFIFSGVMSMLTFMVDGVAQAFLSVEEIKKKVLDEQDIKNLRNAQKEIDDITSSLVKKGIDSQEAQKRARDLYTKSMQASFDAEKERNANLTGDQKKRSDERLAMMGRELDNIKLFFAKKASVEVSSNKLSEEDNKKAQDIALKALETNLIRQQNAISESYLKKEIDSNTYNAKLYTLEDTYLEARLVLFRQFGMDTAEIERQILSRRVAQNEEINAQIAKASENAANVDNKAREEDPTDLAGVLLKSKEEYGNIEKQLQEEDLANDMEYIKRKQGKWAELEKQVSAYAAAEEQITNGLRDIQFTNLETRYNKEQKLIEEQHRKGLLSDDAYNKKKADLEKRKLEEEKKIKKKYALVDFFVQTAKIIASTALSISEAVAAAPMTGGLPWSAINAAIGAVQLGAAYAQYNKVKQLYTGRYNVTGAQDGRQYNNLENIGTPQTGYYSKPVLIADHGGEAVIDAHRTRQLTMYHPQVWSFIKNLPGPPVKQYADGNLPAGSTSGEIPGQSGSNVTNLMLIQVLTRLNDKIDHIQATMSMDHFDQKYTEWQRMKSDVKRA